jgi:hypothetical protein
MRGPGGSLVFATPVQTFDKRRVKTDLFELGEGGTVQVTECWGRLPEEEDVLDHDFLALDGRPVLLLATKPANRLSLFGEKRLRLYPLERDRSRLGLAPLFQADSRMNLWQPAWPKMIDVNADGRDDLVIGYWKGLMDDRVVLDAYLRQEDGGFEVEPRNTAFDVKDGERSFVLHGADLDGDAHADLLIRDQNHLLMYRGTPFVKGAGLVAKSPLAVPLGSMSREPGYTEVRVDSSGDASITVSGGIRPRLLDLDADGTPEVLMVRRGGGEELGVLRIVRFERP